MTMKLFKYPYPHKPLVLKIIIGALLQSMTVSCDDINPLDPFNLGLIHDRKKEYENLTIYNTSNDLLVFSSFENSSCLDSYPLAPCAEIYGCGIIPPLEHRTLVGSKNLRSSKTEFIFGDSIKVKVYNIAVTKRDSDGRFNENFEKNCIAYKWYKVDFLREKIWKLYYPADFE